MHGNPTMSSEKPYSFQERRAVGIQVDDVRPVWREIIIRIPDGEVSADYWDSLTMTERRQWLEDDDER